MSEGISPAEWKITSRGHTHDLSSQCDYVGSDRGEFDCPDDPRPERFGPRTR
jgi:hypothetical protein